MATKLLDLVRETAQLKHLSHRTEESYTQWIKRFILFHKKCHPVDIREEEVRRFLTYLVQQKYVSSSIQNQAFIRRTDLTRYLSFTTPQNRS